MAGFETTRSAEYVVPNMAQGPAKNPKSAEQTLYAGFAGSGPNVKVKLMATVTLYGAPTAVPGCSTPPAVTFPWLGSSTVPVEEVEREEGGGSEFTGDGTEFGPPFPGELEICCALVEIGGEFANTTRTTLASNRPDDQGRSKAAPDGRPVGCVLALGWAFDGARSHGEAS